ncbi:trypsin-like peptidase domain-containing protein [Saprospiraceae bacterium]|nr:trypsin-like peptidase domain-containing protein [Saprospiraceae bacterium]
MIYCRLKFAITSLFIVFTYGFNTINAQAVFSKGIPPSFDTKQSIDIPTAIMPKLDYNKLVQEDKADEIKNIPLRFGYVHKVDYTLENSGEWTILADGGRIWRLKIYAPSAQTINLNYKQYDLPPGGELYIYSDSKKDVLGPFTYQNEKDNGQFATGFTKGEYCTVEYYEPYLKKGKSQIHISGVVHGYRSIRSEVDGILKSFQDSGGCNNDVNCTIGNGWEDQIKSVGLIMTSNNSRFCTGALINNTGDDCHSYFLSANHCFASDNVGDILNDIFMFNYHSPTPACPGTPTLDGPTNQTVQGATVIAKATNSDFCLLELTNNPIDFYDVYYSGWDRSNVASVGASAIHHPSGDVKKISFENATLVSSSYGNSGANTHWQVPDWDQGTTEPGSSGSPLFDLTNQRIIGQLHGGGAACNGSGNNGSPDYYGKISHSWDQNSSVNTEQLDSWLDPINAGVLVMNGNDCAVPVLPVADMVPTLGSTFVFCNADNISFEDVSTGAPTSWSWTFSGAGVSPTSSTLQNPVVSVGTTGILTAVLIATNADGSDMMTYSYPIVVNNCTQNTYCTSPAIPITDNNAVGISSSIILPASNILTDLKIEIDIPHTWVGDLIVKIEHGGITANLLDRPGYPAANNGCNFDNILAIFDDDSSAAAETMCNTSGSAISGLVIPNDLLSVYNGIDPSGVWTLTISDNAAADTGTLDEWCLIVTTEINNSGSPCFSNLTHVNGLMQSETSVADYESSGYIRTTLPTVLDSNAKVDYDATLYIELNAGFEVKLGAEFEAFIDGCNNGSGGINN